MESKNVLRYKTRMTLLGLLTCLLLAPSCTKDDEPDLSEEGTNEWIYKTMKSYYLWYKDIPAKENLDFSQSPDKFFESLLSNQDGVVYENDWLKFSHIEKKKEATKSLDEDDTYGFEFASLKKDNLYYAWVLYVLPGSPAEEAGLKRGDWITGIGADAPNVTNMSAFYKGKASSFLLYRYENDNFIYDRTISMPASRAVADTPFLKDSVYKIGGKNIGYLVYNTFASGPDNRDDSYDKQMKQIFADFKSRNITDFILDLRYNQGGLVNSAQLLTSFLAPANSSGKTFCLMEHNDQHEKENKELKLYTNSELSGNNLDLKRLYVLTGTRTASASEAVINCLIPYMDRSNIVIIGEKTIGKCVGSKTFGTNEKYDWLLHPITLRIYNADHKADYANGFAPDVPIQEIVVGNHLYAFGDEHELLLSEALSRITGQRMKSSSILLENSLMRIVSSSLENKKVNGLIYKN